MIRRSRILSVFIILCAGCGSSTRPSSTAPSVNLGIDVNLYQSNIGLTQAPQVFASMHLAGAKFVRVGIGWAPVETSSGVYSWSTLDQIIQSAQANSLQVLLQVGDNTPSWDLPSGAGGNGNYPPVDCTSGAQDCASFGTYVTALVNHVSSEGVQYIVIRNEPQNSPKNWIGGTEAQFAQFLKAGYAAAHAASSSIKVLNGGTEVLPQALMNDLGYSQSDPSVQFVTAAYSDPNFCNSIDILDVHAGYHGPSFSPQIVDLSEQSIQQCNGGKRVPVWVTETGYSYMTSVQTGTEMEQELGTNYTNGASSQQQYIQDTWGALLKDSNVVGINWTFLVSTSDTDPSLDGAGLGILDSNWNQVASFGTIQSMMAQ